MTGHPEQWSGQRQRDASELREHLLSAPGGDTMANSTTTSGTSTNGSSAAQQRLEEKRREAEAQGSGAAPASERWAIQVYAALSSSLLTGQSAAAASFGSIAVDHIERGLGSVPASDGQLTLFLTAHFVGTTLGSLVCGALGQRFGSRTLMLAVTPFSLLAWLAVALSPSVATMTIGRLSLGFLTMIQMSANVLFISATSSPKYRGLLCNFMEMLVALAVSATFLVGKYLVWRHAAVALGVGFNVLAAGLLAPLPADPLFLLARGRLEEARRALLFYRGADADTSVLKERAVTAAAADERVEVTSLGARLRLLRRRSHSVPLLLLVVQFVVYCWSGAGVVQNYAVVLIRRVGIALDPFLMTIVLNLSRVPITCLNSVLVDRWGRRPLLALSAAGMAACHLAMAASFVWPAVAAHRWLPVASLFSYMVFFALGIGPVTWLLLGELLPRALRELCGGWIMVLFSLLTVSQLQLFPGMLSTLGEAGTFALWAAVMLAYLVFMAVALPETRGLSIEQIERLFESPRDGAQPPRVTSPPPLQV
ncbi:Facilitated trehalose transporter Tret1 [Amphibalanus amphitrite]|uniref:Facilitated trehalose transporter Tret1 n=1 Tax=Amphibalanus amphitrite TaxID=1232801 RepID=A0A6A4X0W8_AMPAM|nr:Facilitated trehalose transporter Tret1 [Amphibalanus amphitrite]